MVEGHNISDNACPVCGYQEIDILTIPVGSYIAYSPSNETVTILATDSGTDTDQTFTASSYTDGWKVFKNNAGQIDIISAESIGNLALKGATGYVKVGYTLNKMANDYVNPEYETMGRGLGYKDGSSIETINTATYPLKYRVSGFPYTDTYFTDDQTTINTAVNGTYPLRHTKTTPEYGSGWVWLASRYSENGSEETAFYAFRLGTNGSNNLLSLYYLYSGGSSDNYSDSRGVRPVISLKPTIKIIGGDGTQASPYILQ